MHSENESLKRTKVESDNLITELNAKLEKLSAENQETLEQKLEELNSIHKIELENMRTSNLNEINRLKVEHAKQIEEIKREHEKILNDEIDRVRKELVDEYEKQIELLKEISDKDETDSVKMNSMDASISNDNVKKLKEQIQLSKELDKDILVKMNEKLLENKMLDQVPDEIKEILDKLDNEGVLLLSLSEILALRSHFRNKNSQSSDENLTKMVEQAEKDKLVEEIYQLKDLLSNLSTENKEDDWRSSYLNAIKDIFSGQKDLLLSELRSFICNSCYSNDDNYLSHFDKKIDNLVNLQKKSFDYLKSIDRESLLKELETIKAELNKVLAEIEKLQENERELKRESELNLKKYFFCF